MGEWWIEDGDARISITTGGLFIGRGVACDIGARDKRVSRRHLLVRLDSAGPVLVLVGRNWARVNGELLRAHEDWPLAGGDRITIPGRELRVLRVDVTTAPDCRPGFLLHHGGALHAINHSPYVVGGATDDDLFIFGWPASAMCCVSNQESLVVEARCEGMMAGGQFLGHGARAILDHGDQIVLAGRRLEVLWRSLRGQIATLATRRTDAPLAASVQRLPGSGGHLVLTFPNGEVSVALAASRFDCVRALLRPPPGHQPGDWIGDDVLASSVWPGDPGKGRVEMSALVSGVRRELARRGIDGQALIQRERGRTRIVLAPGASVPTGDLATADDPARTRIL